jgi:putative lipoic acid-binding regulatory protein
MNRPRETLLEFPCRFPIKAFGKHEPAFEDTVYRLIKAHAPELTVADISSRASSRARYLAVTAEITAHSQDQLDAIYADLTASEAVLMSL